MSGSAARVVLVIDDAADSRDLHAAVLSAAGFSVVTAPDPFAGLARAKALHPCAIVLDLTLPGMDGWELTKRLKADDATRAIPVIAVTGHATGEARDRALRAGVAAYLVKPCDPKDLVAEVGTHARSDKRG